MNSNSAYGKILVITTFVTLLMAICAVIWAGSKVDTKADQAFKYITDNAYLPMRVENNMKNIIDVQMKIEKFQESLLVISRIQSKQEDILTRLETIADDLKEVQKQNKGNKEKGN